MIFNDYHAGIMQLFVSGTILVCAQLEIECKLCYYKGHN